MFTSSGLMPNVTAVFIHIRKAKGISRSFCKTELQKDLEVDLLFKLCLHFWCTCVLDCSVKLHLQFETFHAPLTHAEYIHLQLNNKCGACTLHRSEGLCYSFSFVSDVWTLKHSSLCFTIKYIKTELIHYKNTNIIFTVTCKKNNQ